ncbi:MAG: hypothetical protein MRJ68_12970 [Nitrospira sp.]|nr:hypothetical protein [Nitrospira sp.]
MKQVGDIIRLRINTTMVADRTTIVLPPRPPWKPEFGAALDFDALESSGKTRLQAISELKNMPDGAGMIRTF